jgi:hypothetical protein
MKKRILMLLATVALMVVMLAVSVAPALAVPPFFGFPACPAGNAHPHGVAAHYPASCT